MNEREPSRDEPGRAEPSPDEAIERLLEPLRQIEPEWSGERELQAWAAIAAVTHRRGRPSGLLALGLGAAAAAALIAFALIPSTPPDRRGEVPPAPVSVAGSRVTDHATLPSGAEVRVAGGAVRVIEASRMITRLVLERGRVENVVPTLPAGGTYVVETPSARVRVHGTRFVVQLREDGSTEISVSRGVVEVEPRATASGRPRLLKAGQVTTVSAGVSAGVSGLAASLPAWRRDVRRLRDEAARAGEPLARQNALVRAGRLLSQHAPAEAVEHWRRLRAARSAGPHAEEIAWREMEALRAAGREAEASAAAERFERDYPDSPFAP